MSKRLTKNTHWMPKTGSYAVRLNRRGDIGSTLPDSARAAVLDDLEGRAKRAQEEVEQIDRDLRGLKGDNLRARLIKRKFQLQAELSNLRFDRLTVYFNRYADHFLAAARLLLDEETLRTVEKHVIERIGMPPRHWQRFMGDNGFGKTDTATYSRNEESNDARQARVEEEYER